PEPPRAIHRPCGGLLRPLVPALPLDGPLPALCPRAGPQEHGGEQLPPSGLLATAAPATAAGPGLSARGAALDDRPGGAAARLAAGRASAASSPALWRADQTLVSQSDGPGRWPPHDPH